MKKKGVIILLFIFTLLFFVSFIEDTEMITNRKEEGTLKSNNITIPLWNFSVHKEFFNFKAVAISDNGSYIAAIGADGATVYLFNRLSPKPLWNHTIGGYGNSIAISGNGNYIIAGNGDGEIRLFHISNNIPLWNYSGGGNIYSVDISFNGTYIVAGTQYGSVLLFSSFSSIPIWSFSASGLVLRVAITPNGSYIVAGDNIGNFHLFNKNSNTPLWSCNVEEHVLGVSISSDGNHIAMGSAYPDNGIYYFKKNSSTPIWKYTTSDSVRSVKISADGNYIVAGTEFNDGRIYLFDKDEVNPLWNFSSTESVNSVTMSSDGNYIAAQIRHNYDLGDVLLFNRLSPVPRWSYQVESTDNNGYYAIAISNNGKYITTTTRYDVYLCDRDISSPHPFTLTTKAGNPDTDGNFYLNWTVSHFANNYSIHHDSYYISEQNLHVNTIATGITELSFQVKGFSNGEYYFAIEAQNKFGNQYSNSILIRVQRTPTISGYGISIIFSIMSFLSIVLIIKSIHRKSLSKN